MLLRLDMLPPASNLLDLVSPSLLIPSSLLREDCNVAAWKTKHLLVIVHVPNPSSIASLARLAPV